MNEDDLSTANDDPASKRGESRALVVLPPSGLALRPVPMLPGIIDAETERADVYARAARAGNTHRAYTADISR
jgi:hypothetical protein